jgi:NhaP-type Na+/H+ or K+/H+ antiporter
MEHGLNVGVLAVVGGCFILWGILSGRLERWNVSAPIAFVVFGVVAAHGPLELVHIRLASSDIRSLAEVTLALVLFTDASRVNARRLHGDFDLPVRLLVIGLPLTIGAGTAIAFGLFGGSGIWVAASIAAIVAPTDAALGASVMEDERVPSGVRRLLNIESGLNDGVVTPFVNLFVAGAATAEAVHGSISVAASAVDLVGGAALGVGVGVVGAVLLTLARRHGLNAPEFTPFAILGLAVLAYSTSILAGTNGFVAAFVAGMAFGTVDRQEDETGLGFTEGAGTAMSLLVWFLFGAAMLVPGLEHAGWRDVVFAALALTVVRMVPVALALTGARLDRSTIAFVGWFGPRGLASIVFGLIAFDTLDPAESEVVLAAVTVTVALSVLLHGISAAPLAARYGLNSRGLSSDHREHTDTPAIRTRTLRSGPTTPTRIKP